MIKALIIAILMSLPLSARAQSIKIDLGSNDMDFAMKLGAMFGKVRSDEREGAGTQQFGGLSVGGIFSFDRATSWTVFVTPEVALDAVNKNIIRKGAQAGFIYHLLGGSKKTITPLYNATVITSYPASLGIVGKSSYFEYSVVDPSKLVSTLKGTVIENSLGFDFRYDLASGSSFGTQVSAMLLAVPTGTEGLKTSNLVEISPYWRWSF